MFDWSENRIARAKEIQRAAVAPASVRDVSEVVSSGLSPGCGAQCAVPLLWNSYESTTPPALTRRRLPIERCTVASDK